MTPETQPPARRPRRVRRILLRIFFVLLALLVAAWLFEDIRGRSAWNKYRRAWEAKGEQFDIASVVPKPVPSEQNFATTPFFAPFLDYKKAPKGSGKANLWADERACESNKAFVVMPAPVSSKKRGAPKSGSWEKAEFADLEGWQMAFEGKTNFPFAVTPGEPARDVLTALRKFDALLAELSAASARPHSVFPVHYDEHFNALLPHLATLKSLATITQLRALARLETGAAGAALEDVRLGLRLADTLKSEPLLISQLVRLSMLQMMLQPAWEGLARRRWNEAEVAALQEALARVQVLDAFALAMRGERAFSLHVVDLVRKGEISFENLGETGDDAPSSSVSVGWLLPGGFYRQNQLHLAHMFQDHCLPLIDGGQRRVFPGRYREGEEKLKLRGLHSIFSSLLFPAVSKGALRFARAQGALDLAVIACALERHRFAAGQYPETLAALAPRLLAQVPADTTTGDPLKYRRTDDGMFLLYSVGWNVEDDGGAVSTNRSGVVDAKLGDWVWRYPVK